MTTDKATTRHNVFISAYNEKRHENFYPLNEGFLQGMWKFMIQNYINDSDEFSRLIYTFYNIAPFLIRILSKKQIYCQIFVHGLAPTCQQCHTYFYIYSTDRV
jgi:hypothetical protein